MRYPCLASQRIFDEQLAVAKLKLCQSRIVLETNLTVFLHLIHPVMQSDILQGLMSGR